MADTLNMLTTVDNPFNPWTEWQAWFAFDEARGYHTSALLARVVKTSDELSDADQSQAIEDGIEEIVNMNVSGVHRKIPKPT